METLFVLALFLVLAVGGPLEIWRVLHRRGLGEADTARDPRGLSYAVRRCMLCPSVESCRERLDQDKLERR